MRSNLLRKWSAAVLLLLSSASFVKAESRTPVDFEALQKSGALPAVLRETLMVPVPSVGVQPSLKGILSDINYTTKEKIRKYCPDYTEKSNGAVLSCKVPGADPVDFLISAQGIGEVPLPFWKVDPVFDLEVLSERYRLVSFSVNYIFSALDGRKLGYITTADYKWEAAGSSGVFPAGAGAYRFVLRYDLEGRLVLIAAY